MLKSDLASKRVAVLWGVESPQREETADAGKPP